jgi:hypothetical protein
MGGRPLTGPPRRATSGNRAVRQFRVSAPHTPRWVTAGSAPSWAGTFSIPTKHRSISARDRGFRSGVARTAVPAAQPKSSAVGKQELHILRRQHHRGAKRFRPIFVPAVAGQTRGAGSGMALVG